VDRADGAHADHVRKPDACVGVLSRARFRAQLGGQFGDLTDTGRADGMTHRKQPTRGVDRGAAAYVELTSGQRRRGLARFTQPHRFDVEQFLHGECVV
jgi:hypothetical protein